MPTIHLPDDPTLERLREEAKRLRDAVREGRSDALALVAAHHPDGVPTCLDAFPLHAAQVALARRYGFRSWPRLKAHLDVIARYRWPRRPARGRPGPTPTTAQAPTLRASHPAPPETTGRAPTRAAGHGARPTTGIATGDMVDEFCELACLTYTHEDGPDRWARARDLLADHPDLPDRDICAAVVAADLPAVTRLLAADPPLATREAGPRAWEPLCYLAFSRLRPDVPEAAVLDIARLLLAAGADPEAGYLWRGLTTPFTALTGAFGEGEQGPARQPRHPHSQALARLLLSAGADPHDGQALYNRMFRPDDSHLELLFAAGLGSVPGGRWTTLLRGALETPEEMLARQVHWAAGHRFTDRMRLLIGHGVDVRSPDPYGRTPIEVAAANGDAATVEVLAATGIPRPHLTGMEALVAACLAGDRDTVDALCAADPDLLAGTRSRHPDLVCRADHARSVAVLAGLGFDVDAMDRGHTALHRAAWDGRLDLVEALIGSGADPGRRDEQFHGTPLDWARHAYQEKIVNFLSQR